MRLRIKPTRVWITAGALVAFAQVGLGAQTPAPPDPVLVVTGLTYIESGGHEWTRYLFRVENRAHFSNELFAASPELPPCGSNTKAARAWIDLYDSTGKRLNGFCALENNEALGELWFVIPSDSAPPPSVYIVLTDRKTGTKLKSNLAPTSKRRGPGSAGE